MNGRLAAGLFAFFAFAVAQPTTAQEPLQVTIFFKGSSGPFGPTDPIIIGLQIKNPSANPVFTTDGWFAQEFWRRLFFTDPVGGIITNAAEGQIHGESRVFHCFSRQRVLQRPTAIPVVPVDVVPGNSVLEFEIRAKDFYDLTRPGTWRVNARTPIQTFDFGDSAVVITDCDQFEGETVVRVGPGVGAGRQAFTLVSNDLVFDILGDSTPPTTTVTRFPPENSAGWNKGDVTLNFSATDDLSGVQRIVVATTGAQAGETIISGNTGSLTITAEGNTTVTFHAEDNAGNAEKPQSLLVRLDKKDPEITTLAPASGNFSPYQTVTVTFSADDPGPALGVPSSGLAALQATVTYPSGTSTPIASGTTITLNPGTTQVNVTARDTAGNQTTRSAQYAAATYTFVGFGPPVGSEAACTTAPRLTSKFGSTVPVKFQLFLNNVVVSNAVATIAVAQVSDTPPSQEPTDLGTGASDTGNRFRFDPTSNQYIFNLNTKVLSKGVWCIKAILDDGTTHTVPIGLR